MSQATAYQRRKNFLDNNPDRTDHGALNDEFDGVSTSVQGLRTNLALIQADDGALRAAVVGVAQLTPEAQANLSQPGPEGPEGPAGQPGIQGQQGIQGAVGASFNADVRGLDSERPSYGNRLKGFSFMAMDTGLLYFKLSSTVDDWSQGFVFGKGEPGARGQQGPEGPRGLQGLRGLPGLQGIQGPVGPPGPVSTVDYSRVVRNDLLTDQTMQGRLAAQYLSGATGIAAPLMRFTGYPLRLLPVNTRLRLDDGQSTPGLAALEVLAVHTAGTEATSTGLKLANGTDIGTLFDPAGSSASKLAGVAQGESSVAITGKTTLKVTLAVQNNQLTINLEAT